MAGGRTRCGPVRPLAKAGGTATVCLAGLDRATSSTYERCVSEEAALALINLLSGRAWARQKAPNMGQADAATSAQRTPRSNSVHTKRQHPRRMHEGYQ
jgi:hypothetical protein